MGELKKWVWQNWVRIGTDGKIKGKCGTSKNKKNPDRSLLLESLLATAKKKKREGATGKQFVRNVKGVR